VNRQVPSTNKIKPIAIIGNGKMARHMIRYFELVHQPYVHWFRQTETVSNSAKKSRLARFKQFIQPQSSSGNPSSLKSMATNVDVLLILIPDDQIEKFITSNPCLANKTCVHFSGSLTSHLAIGCHPLMTFGEELYELDQYQSVPFVVDEGVAFSKIFPKFNNAVHTISSVHKAKYHAFCVMAGNFSQLMWKVIGEELPQMGLPADVMSAYLLQNTRNFIKDPQKSVTGPLYRGDFATIANHQIALAGHPMAKIYQAFLELHQPPNDMIKRSQV
jgi:predicted short-subunit dehydrogenase-like oxidoreductase (DUF2520 family)